MINIDTWGIDIFKVAELSNNRPLTAVTYTILQVCEPQFLHCIEKQKAWFCSWGNSGHRREDICGLLAGTRFDQDFQDPPQHASHVPDAPRGPLPTGRAVPQQRARHRRDAVLARASFPASP